MHTRLITFYFEFISILITFIPAATVLESSVKAGTGLRLLWPFILGHTVPLSLQHFSGSTGVRQNWVLQLLRTRQQSPLCLTASELEMDHMYTVYRFLSKLVNGLEYILKELGSWSRLLYLLIFSLLISLWQSVDCRYLNLVANLRFVTGHCQLLQLLAFMLIYSFYSCPYFLRLLIGSSCNTSNLPSGINKVFLILMFLSDTKIQICCCQMSEHHRYNSPQSENNQWGHTSALCVLFFEDPYQN